MATPVGAIKLGATTIALRVGRLGDGGRPETLSSRRAIVCLGAGLAETGCLRTADMETVLAHLGDYRAELDALGAEGVFSAAGSALRRAGNTADFLGLVADRVGLSVRVLSGDEEGRVTYAGVAAEVSEPVLLVDIGGGSTEFVDPERSLSVDVGTLALTRARAWPDPPAPALERMRREVRRHLDGRIDRRTLPSGCSRVVAVGGTANQLRKLGQASGRIPEQPGGSPGEGGLWTSDQGELVRWLEILARLPLAARAQLPGMAPERASLIVAGLVILDEILTRLGTATLAVSQSDTCYGLWLLAAQGYRGPGWTQLVTALSG